MSRTSLKGEYTSKSIEATIQDIFKLFKKHPIGRYQVILDANGEPEAMFFTIRDTQYGELPIRLPIR